MEAKKILMSICAALISVCVALSVVGCKKDEDAEAGSNLAYKLTENGYVVNGFSASEVEENVVIPSKYKGKPVIEIAASAFQGTEIKTVSIPDGITSIGNKAFKDCYSLINIMVDSANANYSSLDGNLYNKDQTEFIQYAMGKTATSFIVPDSVTSIGAWAFYQSGYLTSITMGDNVQSIGNMAFYFCSKLTNVTIGKSVVSIGSYAFEACKNLTNMTYKGGVEEWSAVEKGFYWNYEIAATEVVCVDGNAPIK